MSEIFSQYVMVASLLSSLLLTGLGIYLLWRPERRAASHPRPRHALTDAEFYQRFYAAEELAPETVARMRARFAAAAAAPAETLLPEDSFLSLGVIDSEACQKFVIAVALELRARSYAGKLITLDDYIRAVASDRGALAAGAR